MHRKKYVHSRAHTWSCVCWQCQSLPVTHRGQTNALISSWHAATTFLPLAPSASLSLFLPLSLSLFLFSLLLSFNLSFCVPLFSKRTGTTHLSLFLTKPHSCKARHWCQDNRPGLPNEVAEFKLESEEKKQEKKKTACGKCYASCSPNVVDLQITAQTPPLHQETQVSVFSLG